MRFQPPVYSPISLDSIPRALSAAILRSGEGAGLARSLEDRFSADRAVLTASGTQALQMALRLAVAARSDGRRVVALPAYSCFDLVTAAIGASVRVRFYDVDPVTLSPDLESLREVVRAGVAAVVLGNLYGYPIDWPAVRDACGVDQVLLIEDAAQGLGSSGAWGAAGSQGDLTTLSFGRGKGWTGGGGGALLLRSPEFEDASRQAVQELVAEMDPAGLGLRSAVVSAAAWALGRPSLYALPTSVPALGLGETSYHEPTRPRGMSRFSTALALRTAAGAVAAVPQRRRTAEVTARAFVESVRVGGRVSVCEPVGGGECCSYLRLPVLAASSVVARSLCLEGAHLGVAPGYPTPLHILPQGRDIAELSHSQFPGAIRLADCVVTFPTHGWVRERDIRESVLLVESVAG